MKIKDMTTGEDIELIAPLIEIFKWLLGQEYNSHKDFFKSILNFKKLSHEHNNIVLSELGEKSIQEALIYRKVNNGELDELIVESLKSKNLFILKCLLCQPNAGKNLYVHNQLSSFKLDARSQTYDDDSYPDMTLPLLHWIIRHWPEATPLLLEAGADIEQYAFPSFYKPLDIAALTNNFHCVDLLVNAGARKAVSVIHRVLQTRNQTMFAHLKNLGFELNLTEDPYAVFSAAVRNGHADILDALWEEIGSKQAIGIIKDMLRYFINPLKMPPQHSHAYKYILSKSELTQQLTAIKNQDNDPSFIFKVMSHINDSVMKEELYHFAIDYALRHKRFQFLNLLTEHGIEHINHYDRVADLEYGVDELKAFLTKQSTPKIEEVSNNPFSHFASTSNGESSSQPRPEQ